VNKFEIHVGGAISLLFRRLHDATADAGALARMAPVAAGIASFYASRATRDADGSGRLSLHNVVPPDEFATGWPIYSGVTNSVYVNAVAILAAAFAARTSPQHKDRGLWDDLASNLTVISSGSGESLYHPEYVGFPASNRWFGGKVKQADVTMLLYPLQDERHVTVASARNDLLKYGPMYDPAGPAMTESVSVVSWLALDEREKAAQQLARSDLNMQPPFNVWTESKTPRQHVTLKDQGCFNFLTGAGGYAQGIVAGYAGLRLVEHALVLRPQLPPGATSFGLRGLAYRGGKLSVSLDAHGLRTCLQALGSGAGFDVACVDGCDSKNASTTLRRPGDCAAFTPGTPDMAATESLPASLRVSAL
jgi:trehalose/maltose hydrolase-like predicted phosphorylase